MTVVTFRSDAETEALLAALATEGESRSDTIRQALRDAMRLRRREAIRAESKACLGDPDDLAEAQAVLADTESLRAW